MHKWAPHHPLALWVSPSMFCQMCTPKLLLLLSFLISWVLYDLLILQTVCPWCYIGKRRLEKAMAQFPGPASLLLDAS